MLLDTPPKAARTHSRAAALACIAPLYDVVLHDSLAKVVDDYLPMYPSDDPSTILTIANACVESIT